MLEDFQTGTASMALKRHLASNARGFYGFCLMTQIEVHEVQRVLGVQKGQLRLIRLIRGGEDRAIWISEAATWGKPCCRLDDYSERRGSLCEPTTRDERIHSIPTIPVHRHEVLYQFRIGIDILIATPV